MGTEQRTLCVSMGELEKPSGQKKEGGVMKKLKRRGVERKKEEKEDFLEGWAGHSS